MDIRFKILWLDNSLGIAINQINGTNTIPLTNYYFWPKNDVWGQIRLQLNSKNWITDKEKVQILNSVTDILNNWQKNKKKELIQEDKNIEFAGIS